MYVCMHVHLLHACICPCRLQQRAAEDAGLEGPPRKSFYTRYIQPLFAKDYSSSDEDDNEEDAAQKRAAAKARRRDRNRGMRQLGSSISKQLA